MKKIILAFLACFAFGIDENEIKFYEQILASLKTEQIPPFIAQLARENLPHRVDEMVTLQSLSYKGLDIEANFALNDTENRKISRYSANEIRSLKKEFYENGKAALCATAISHAVLNRGITLKGRYALDGRHFFDIKMDKRSCE